jgi:tetratricopeptide (TPR) repeat protein
VSGVAKGLAIEIHPGPPDRPARRSLEVDIGAPLPVAFSGLRRLIRALQEECPELALPVGKPEWSWLFPAGPADASAVTETPARDLFELADAPNQRRLFRESEQTYRVLNMAAHVLVAATTALARPLCLRNTGTCDLVSLRGLMHAAELARLGGMLGGVRGRWELCDWGASSSRGARRPFAATRAAHCAQIARRLRASGGADPPPALDAASVPGGFITGAVADRHGGVRSDDGPEGRYLERVVDDGASLAQRLAAALLAVRACFFSTNHEGATLAAETGLELLARPSGRLDGAVLRAAWDAEDDPRFAVPMLEVERSDLDDANHLRAQLYLHLGVTRAFAGQTQEALEAFARGLGGPSSPDRAGGRLSPGCVADLHMHRAVAFTKGLGRIDEARRDIDAGLAALAGQPIAVAALPEAWLHNLSALTFVMERRFDRARHEEERALGCIDGIDGPSATHLKTNLVSNFSVLAEAEGDLGQATRIWRAFEPLNRKLGSDNADKGYAFRLGALRSLQGDVAGSIEAFEAAFAKAEATGDVFNGETIAAALARAELRRGAGATAADWYHRAAGLAGVAGDCLHRARDLAGVQIAVGRRDFSEARACLTANSTYDLSGLALPEALRSGTGTDVLEALALGRPRNKLTRPFDLVNVSLVNVDVSRADQSP